jgi:transposase
MSYQIYNKILGCDVGIRTLLTFSNGSFYHYKIDHEDLILIKKCQSKKFGEYFKNELTNKILEDFKKTYNKFWNDCCFVFESYLLETGYIIPPRLQRKKFNEIFAYKVFIDLKLIPWLKEEGKIVFAESKNSSIECAECGHIDVENRKNINGYISNQFFYCVACQKMVVNSDLNAARVLLKRYLNSLK